MNKLFIIIPLLFFINVNELKVISYNIRYNNPNDGVNIWDNRKSTIAEFIYKENPDFAGLQEVTHPQLIFLSQNLSEHSFIGVGRADGKTEGEYSPIFFNRKKYKLLLNKTFWLSHDPEKVSVGWDAAMERICTYGLFENIFSKQKIWVFNTHFDHVGIEARRESTTLILKKIKELNTKNYPLILTGDFNLDDQNSSIKKLQSQLNDVLLNINVLDNKYGTYNGFKRDRTEKKRIDYIFVKNLIIKEAQHKHLKTKNQEWASDHHPVLSILKI